MKRLGHQVEQSSEVRSVFYAMSKGVVHVPRAQ